MSCVRIFWVKLGWLPLRSDFALDAYEYTYELSRSFDVLMWIRLQSLFWCLCTYWVQVTTDQILFDQKFLIDIQLNLLMWITYCPFIEYIWVLKFSIESTYVLQVSLSFITTFFSRCALWTSNESVETRNKEVALDQTWTPMWGFLS